MIEICKDYEYWDGMVIRGEQGSVFHLWDWLKIVEKHTSSKLYPLIAIKGSTPIALYPFFLKRKCAFSPPPKSLLLYLGPIFLKYDSLKQSRRESTFMEVQKEVDEFLRDLGCVFFRVRTTPLLPDCRPLKWNGYSIDPLYTYQIDLKGGCEKVWEGLNRKLRVGIEKTRRSGVRVEQGDLNDLNELRILLYERFLEQGLGKSGKQYYRDYLRDLYRRFHPENMRVFVAKLDGDVVGGLVVLRFGRWAGLWIGIPKTDLKGIYPNDLAQWEAIRWACGVGCDVYEEMDAGNLRFRHFKAKYNPKAVPWFSAEKYFGILGRLVHVLRR